MGGVPSRDASPTFFSLRYGAHEVGLIPLLHAYFRSEEKELRGQFVRMRNDPSVRYSFMRGTEYNMRQLPPASYTEEKLDKLLDVIDATLYDTAKEMLEDEKAPLRPVPCAVCFVYVNGREGTECFPFYGRRINVIGHFGCHKYEDRGDEEPCLYLRKAILKAAGDRTLERVVTLAAMVLKEEFFRAAASVYRGQEATELFSRRISRLSLISGTLWNRYPVLKLLHDTAAFAWSVENVQEHRDAPRFCAYEVPETGESGLVMQMDGSLLLRFIWRACSTVIPSMVRGMWEQFVLDDALTQQKERVMSNWLKISPEVNIFLGGEEFTSRVKNHLENLLREVVRARETPTDDLSVWSAEQECGPDGKIYRIFNSPICGPFLATVNVKREKSHGTSNGYRKAQQAFEPKLNNFGAAVKSRGGVPLRHIWHANMGPQAPTTGLLPEYDETVNYIASPRFVSPGPSTICHMALPVSVLPPSGTSLAATHSSSVVVLQQPLSPTPESLPISTISAPVSSGFLPFYQELPKPTPLAMQSLGMPYVVLTKSVSAIAQQNPIPVNTSVTTAKGGTDRNNGNGNGNGNGNRLGGGTGNAFAKCGGATSTLFQPQLTTPGPINGATFSNLVNVTTGLQQTCMQSVGNYVLLPDGRIGLLGSAPVTSTGYLNP
ncbi:uncharacterized protein Tco025E_02093 [Trypanosoma conorhini]|uniref:Uncharacterized protein n=1 Tax=Trypanosoma conorhini TaxID=83891 RepID=A0A3S5IUF9_9TRYP|nr:uncharacterized protein Tco025E_02093 [Trypanosoma conorhini]RNF25597.1 hypothetical protein Tco025E_02093 [Trypanosoma conorhini]